MLHESQGVASGSDKLPSRVHDQIVSHRQQVRRASEGMGRRNAGSHQAHETDLHGAGYNFKNRAVAAYDKRHAMHHKEDVLLGVAMCRFFFMRA